MVGTSKILTVSYGTFSCTLEGFDDPFSTMRTIAEYFRDLAAEDRYFGAEPPTPDVSHLHALAQENNPRPVAAHVQDNGLRLTQQGSEDDAAQAAPEPPVADAAALAPEPSPVPDAVASTPATDLPAGDTDEEDLALLLDGIDEDDAEAGDGENLFDVEAEPAPEPKPAYDPRAVIAAKLENARAETAEADAVAEEAPRRVRTPNVSADDLAAAAARSPSRNRKRPDAFREDLDSLNDQQAELSDEDEAELMAELASLEEETAGDAKGKALLQSDLIEREDAAIDRLLAKTNSKLTDSDVQQKHASLSHLKAAVAATMADRSASDDHETGREDPDTAYRADLAKAVQPKPQAAKPPPLMLVSSSDAPEAKPQARKSEGAVRPRRVDTKPNPQARRESDAGFATYAERVGATQLNDLMEAAAAYLNTVEGVASFTRPQVMHMVLRSDRGKNFTREDSLRAFDGLVRKGTIAKVEHGQFVIREDSRYVS